ncbi:glycoside hydrolase family 72 protein [Myriangium duriaei CBS 260.36]|uniref:1,3-beta-glucanosyltransferase n=1 Tax=Myriangium duriaei CBS 260.36 TaxID=1168546 RepID=A0A9P4IZ36_9PEZI|nr:glycoside hydrolase family 72 protein [Myriangium duriaei CBS 260.36]
MRFFGVATIASLFSLAACATLPTITTKGSKFFTSSGDQWFVKGVAYQLSPDDPLLDVAQCTMDASLMASLGANAIRVYHVISGDHSGCMQAFADKGIYVFVDLDTFTTQIEQTDPHFNQTQLSSFESVMDEFHTFDNVAGFFIANEVVTTPLNSAAAAFVKLSVQLLKEYRINKGYRAIPIGYSHADVAGLRPMMQNYLACGTNLNATVDFFGLNTYEWCGDSNYATSGYQTITDQIKNYPVPIFLSEDGCNTVQPRTFQDQLTIFGPSMAPYWSGAIIYEWIQETNAYGLVTYGGNAQAVAPADGPTSVQRSGTPTPITPDFSNLKSAWSSATASSVSAAAYSPSLTNPPCPAYTTPGSTTGWGINGDVALPTLGQVYDASASSSVTAGTAGASAASGTAASSSSSKGAGSTVQDPSRTGFQSVVISFAGLLLSFAGWF